MKPEHDNPRPDMHWYVFVHGWPCVTRFTFCNQRKKSSKLLYSFKTAKSNFETDFPGIRKPYILASSETRITPHGSSLL